MVWQAWFGRHGEHWPGWSGIGLVLHGRLGMALQGMSLPVWARQARRGKAGQGMKRPVVARLGMAGLDGLGVKRHGQSRFVWAWLDLAGTAWMGRHGGNRTGIAWQARRGE